MTLDKDGFPATDTPEDNTPAAEALEAEPVPEDEAPLSITVDDGLKRIPIHNKLKQKIGEFRFRPSDFEIVTRFNSMADRWNEVTDALDDMIDGEDGSADLNDPRTIAALEAAKKKLFSLCDYAFGEGASEAFFSVLNPFAPIDGNLYCENVFTAVGDFLSRYFQRETRKLNSRVAKYMPTTRDHLRKGGRRRN